MADALDLAIDNNIHLCATVLGQFGTTVETRDCAAFFHGPKRALYPSVITRAMDIDDDTQADIQSLPHGSGVKDSFATLDLSDLGYTAVVPAQWITRRGHKAAGPPHLTTTRDTLGSWRKAWGDDDKGQANFTPALLSSPGVTLRHSADMTAGLITSGGVNGVTGVSNIFGAPERALAGLTDVPEAERLVGYEANPAPFLALGFETLGPLTIWIKTG